jgi:hypothetical protein
MFDRGLTFGRNGFWVDNAPKPDLLPLKWSGELHQRNDSQRKSAPVSGFCREYKTNYSQYLSERKPFSRIQILATRIGD